MAYSATNSGANSQTTVLIDDNRLLRNFREFSGSDSAVGNTSTTSLNNTWIRCDHRNFDSSSDFNSVDLFSDDYSADYKKHVVVFNSVVPESTGGVYTGMRLWIHETFNSTNYQISASNTYQHCARRSSNYVTRTTSNWAPISYWYNYPNNGHGQSNGYIEFWTDRSTKFNVYQGVTANYQNTSYCNFYTFRGYVQDERRFAGIRFLANSGNFRRNQGGSATLYRQI